MITRERGGRLRRDQTLIGWEGQRDGWGWEMEPKWLR